MFSTAGLGYIIGNAIPLTISLLVFVHFFMQFFKLSDKRVKLTSEIVSAIRIIKYNAWEGPFRLSVEKVRHEEMQANFNAYCCYVSLFLFIVGVFVVLPVIVFYAFVALGHQLDSVRAFTTLSLLALIQGPVSFLPSVLQEVATAIISMNRILTYLNTPEIQNYVVRDAIPMEVAGGPGIGGSPVPSIVIRFDGAYLGWIDEAEAQARKEDASGVDGSSTTKGTSLMLSSSLSLA